MNHYDTLGVKPNADKNTVRKAYRAKAKKLHPDVPGGDPAAFRRLQLAYDIISDDQRRAQYDEFGNASDENTPESEANRVFADALVAMIERNDARCTNVVTKLRDDINKTREICQREVSKHNSRIANLQEAIKRIVTIVPSSNDPVIIRLKANIQSAQSDIQNANFKIAVADAMLTILERYSYNAAKDNRGFTTSDFRSLMGDAAIFKFK